MAFRVSFRYSQQMAKLGGWTENFWNSLSDLSVVATKADDFAFLLNRIHGDTSFLTGFRISDSTSFRDVQNVVYGGGTGLAKATSPIQTSDYATTALLLKSVGVGNYVVRQWIKGIWDSQVDNGGFYKPTGSFITRINAVLAALLVGTNGWVLRVTDRTVPSKPVKDLTQAGIVTVAAHGYLDNAIIRISRCKGLTQANKRWRITLIDANTFSLQGWVAPAVVTPYLGNGVAKLQVPIYVGIQQSYIERATEHKVGRPLEQLTGRRKVRRT